MLIWHQPERQEEPPVACIQLTVAEVQMTDKDCFLPTEHTTKQMVHFYQLS